MLTEGQIIEPTAPNAWWVRTRFYLWQYIIWAPRHWFYWKVRGVVLGGRLEPWIRWRVGAPDDNRS